MSPSAARGCSLPANRRGSKLSIREAEAVALVRDLVNTPAGDLGPAELEQAVREQAERIGAEVRVTSGKDLDEGYPLIAAVGRAASPERAPRLIELEWGDPDHPRVAIIGKGVCFDSGGLDLKPASGMRLMKKDMGGAAHALALAGPDRRRAAAGPASSCSSRPSRMRFPATPFGPATSSSRARACTVEIDNTDAEGRLILADALTKAGEGEPELIVDFATLTGAARIALGPDLPALFSQRRCACRRAGEGRQGSDRPAVADADLGRL